MLIKGNKIVKICDEMMVCFAVSTGRVYLDYAINFMQSSLVTLPEQKCLCVLHVCVVPDIMECESRSGSSPQQ